MFEEITNPPDATYEVVKPLKNTSYVKGCRVYGYLTDTGRITVGVFIGTESPRVWRVLDSEEVDRLINTNYLKKII